MTKTYEPEAVGLSEAAAREANRNARELGLRFDLFEEVEVATALPPTTAKGWVVHISDPTQAYHLAHVLQRTVQHINDLAPIAPRHNPLEHHR